MAKSSTTTALMGLYVLIVCCCAAVVAEAEYAKYKDPKQPISYRIRDLMKRMTLEEKIGQMVQIERKFASPDVMKNYFIGININIFFCFCFFKAYVG